MAEEASEKGVARLLLLLEIPPQRVLAQNGVAQRHDADAIMRLASIFLGSRCLLLEFKKTACTSLEAIRTGWLQGNRLTRGT